MAHRITGHIPDALRSLRSKLQRAAKRLPTPAGLLKPTPMIHSDCFGRYHPPETDQSVLTEELLTEFRDLDLDQAKQRDYRP